jgi:hypothetical protein
MPSETTTPIRSSRLRFGLKTLFVIVTALCLWLGYRAILARRANEIASRHHTVLEAIYKQLPHQRVPTHDSTPPGSEDALVVRLAQDSIAPGGEDKLLLRLERAGKKFQRVRMLRVDHTDPETSQNAPIDVLKLLASNTHPTTIADKLVQHYGIALSAIGFHQIFSHGGSRGDLESVSGTCRGIWSSPTSDIQVVIDGEVFAQSKSAMVTILLIDSQQLQLW